MANSQTLFLLWEQSLGIEGNETIDPKKAFLPQLYAVIKLSARVLFPSPLPWNTEAVPPLPQILLTRGELPRCGARSYPFEGRGVCLTSSPGAQIGYLGILETSSMVPCGMRLDSLGFGGCVGLVPVPPVGSGAWDGGKFGRCRVVRNQASWDAG